MTRTARVLALLTALSAFYLLVAGAHVNAYRAALSVPDWPLSYGKILAPEWPGNIFYEQHHRATAATTLILFIATAVVLWRNGARPAVRRAAAVAGAALGVQIFMGGLIVLRLNPPWLGALHVVTAVATVVAIAALAALVWSDWRAPVDPALGRIRSRTRAAVWLALLAASIGAVTRHPLAGELQFVAALVAHLLVAVLSILWLTMLGLSLVRLSLRPLRRWGWCLLAGVLLQLVVGGWVFVVSPEPWSDAYPPPASFPNAHAAHIVLAAWITTCLVAVLLRSGGWSRSAASERLRHPQ